MSDLPPDVPRLRTLETYLRLQLRAVEAAIYAAETGAPPYLPKAAATWQLQRLPGGPGPGGRNVLHRDGCPFAGGATLTREEAVIALDEGAEACEQCHPGKELRGNGSCAGS